MKKDQCEALMIDTLDTYLQDLGYAYVPRWKQYRKATPNGFVSYILSISPYQNECMVELHAGVRIEDVEGLVFPFTNSSPGWKGQSMTVVSPLSKIMGRDIERYPVHDFTTAAATSYTLLDQIQIYGEVFLRQYQDLTELFLLYNESPSAKHPLLKNHYHRAIRGITLAKLNQSSQLFDLVGIYKEQLVRYRTPQRYIDAFDRLAHFLLHYSLN